jgi:hypothetical protein
MSPSSPRGLVLSELDKVEDDLLLILKESETIINGLKNLPEKEKIVNDASLSIFSRLLKCQSCLLDNLDGLKEFMPFERSSEASHASATRARYDLINAKLSLEVINDAIELESEAVADSNLEEPEYPKDHSSKKMRML